MSELITPEAIEAAFTRSEGGFHFARWRRPIAPIVFGVEDKTLEVVKGALEAMTQAIGHSMAETDPELGSNMMFFFFRDWRELLGVKGLDRMVPELGGLVSKLSRAEANQYRLFRFEAEGAISAVFVFLCMDQTLADIPAEEVALAQVAQSLVLWSDSAFIGQSPLGKLPNGVTVLRPDVALLLKAAYDPILPDISQDKSHALRLFARLDPQR